MVDQVDEPPLENIVSTMKTEKSFDPPVVHSTINVATGRGKPTVPELAEFLADDPPIDRTSTYAYDATSGWIRPRL